MPCTTAVGSVTIIISARSSSCTCSRRFTVALVPFTTTPVLLDTATHARTAAGSMPTAAICASG